MISSSESKPYQPSDDASGAGGQGGSVIMAAPVVESVSSVGGGLRAIRVQDVNEVQNLLVSVSNEEVARYVLKHFRDPDTLIMRYGRSCFVVTVVRHDLFEGTALIVWAQNPDNYPTRVAYEIIEQWSRSRGCHHIATYVDPDSKLWKRMAATKRLTGMRPYKIVISTGSNLI